MLSLINVLSNTEDRSNTNLFQRTEQKRETLPHWFYKNSIFLMPKQGKFVTQKENYKLTCPSKHRNKTLQILAN